MTIIDKSNPNQVLQRIEAALNNSEPEKLEYYSQIFKEEALNNLNSYLQLLNLPNE
jgi:hypothetical protein